MTTGQDVLEKVFQHLNLIETAYFGLRYLDATNQTVSIILNIRIKLLKIGPFKGYLNGTLLFKKGYHRKVFNLKNSKS